MSYRSRFDIEYQIYKGHPIMEILKDGAPFWEDLPGAKDHFRFGIDKAETIMTSMPTIELFLESKGKKPNTAKPRIEEDDRYCPWCKIRRFNGFSRNSKFIDRPYLEISGYAEIKFGLLKARALIEKRGSIEHFIRNNT